MATRPFTGQKPGASAGRPLLKAMVSGPGLPLQGWRLHTGMKLGSLHVTFGLRLFWIGAVPSCPSALMGVGALPTSLYLLFKNV